MLSQTDIASRIATLDDQRFAEFANELLVRTAVASGIDRSSLALNLHIHEKDGGIDARCENARARAGRLIPCPNVIYQFKSGKRKTPGALAEEDILNKTRVIHYLYEREFCLVYLAGWSAGDAYEDQVVEALREKQRELVPKRFFFLGADTLAILTQSMPALLFNFLQFSASGLLTHADWSRMEDMRNQFFRDVALDGALRSLQEQTREPYSRTRVVGAAGNGKSRMVLESLRDSEFEKLVLYAEEPEQARPELLDYLCTTPDAQCVLVVDEASADDFERLKRRLNGAGPQVRLIAIGREAQSDQAVLKVGGLSQQLLAQAIGSVASGLPVEDAQSLAGDCHGSPKLALIVARTLRDAPRSRFEILSNRGLRNRLVSFLGLNQDSIEWRALSMLSLLTRVGWRERAEPECERLFQFDSLEVGAARRCIEELDRRLGVVPRASRFVYVSPDILADHLALSQLESWTKRKLQDFFGLLTPEMQDSFMRRLRRIQAVLENRQNVEEVLFGPDGPFQRLADLQENPHLGKILRRLAVVFPASSLRALRRIVNEAPLQELREARTSRRDLVWTLEDLLWYAEHFETTATILLRLAVAENEEIANNATAIWVETFQTFLGRTRAGLDQRMRVLREAASGTSAERILAAMAMKAALNMGYSSRMGAPPDDVPEVPETWAPTTWEEQRRCLESYLTLLRTLLEDSSQDVVREASQALAMALVGCIEPDASLRDRWFESADTLARERPTLMLPVAEEIESLLARNREWPEKYPVSEEAHRKLREFLSEHTSRSFGLNLRLTLKERYIREEPKREKQHLEPLAHASLSQPDVILEQLEWMQTADGPRVETFFEMLGTLDGPGDLQAPLLQALISGQLRPHWLASYLRGQGADIELERLEAPLLEIGGGADVLWDLCLARELDTAGFERLIRLLRSGQLTVRRPANLLYSRWLAKLTVKQIQLLISLPACTPDQAVDLLWSYLADHPECIGDLASDALKALDEAQKEERSYHFELLAEQIAEVAPDAVFKLVVRADQSAMSHLEAPRLLQVLWPRIDQQETWNSVIAPLLLEQTASAWLARRKIRGLPLESLGVPFLLDWISEEPATRAPAMADITGAPAIPLTELQAALLERFAPEVGNTFYHNYLAGSFYGPLSQTLGEKHEQAQAWLRDERPNVRSWADHVLANLDAERKHQLDRETEESLTGEA